jgi:hypothetical protein
MHLGKARPKIALSCSHRRLRLGLAHHGAPSTWIAPIKEQHAEGKRKKRR